MSRRFRTTTALATSLSLILPVPPAFAQEMICADGTALPCAEGVEAVPVPQAQPVPEATEEVAPEVQLVPESPVSEEPAAEAAPIGEDQPAAEAAPAAEEQPAGEAAPVAEEQPATEAPLVEEQPAAETAPVVEEQPAEEVPSLEAQPATDEPAVDAPVAETEPEAPAAEPTPEAVQEPAAEPVVVPEVTTEEAVTPEPASVEPSVEDLEKALAGEEQPAVETATPAGDTAAEAAVPDEVAPQVEGAVPPVAAAVADVAQELADDGIIPSEEVVPDLPVQPEAASGEAPIAEAAALLASTDAGGAPVAATADAPADSVALVTEELVTDKTARSSAQDFANKVDETATVNNVTNNTTNNTYTNAAPAPTVVKRHDKLSDAEKLLLLGAGALVVGAILSNNRKVEMNSGDRVVVSRDGQYYLLKDDDSLLRQPGSRVRTENFRDGSTRTTVTRDDGSRIVTIRDAEQRVLRRVHVDPYGREVMLIDDTVAYDPVDITRLPRHKQRPELTSASDEAALRAALEEESGAGRRFSLAQIRNLVEVRSLVPEIDLNAITFASGSAAIAPDQAKALAGLGKLMRSYVKENPAEQFLIEGHTDAVGSAAYNLALSDRRAESLALALTEYFGVPPENMVVQGYGERFLKVDTQGDERANRRTSVRRITNLMR